jgi:hypothetical protein
MDKPAATFASSHEFLSDLFDANEAAMTEITVSPAPVTS